MMNHPGLAQLRQEVGISTIFMVTVPTATYCFFRFCLADYLHPHEKLYSAIACIVALWCVIVVIVIVKYWDDFKAVYQGQGNIPYDKSLAFDVEYMRSDEYFKEEQAREDREEKKQKAARRYESRKNANSILKVFTNFDAGLSSDEDILTKTEEESKKLKKGEKANNGEKEEEEDE